MEVSTFGEGETGVLVLQLVEEESKKDKLSALIWKARAWTKLNAIFNCNQAELTFVTKNLVLLGTLDSGAIAVSFVMEERPDA